MTMAEVGAEIVRVRTEAEAGEARVLARVQGLELHVHAGPDAAA